MSICKQGAFILHVLKGNKVLWKINHHYIKIFSQHTHHFLLCEGTDTSCNCVPTSSVF